MEMDPATALELVTHGSTLLLLDAPLYTLIGIDTQGIKMVRMVLILYTIALQTGLVVFLRLHKALKDKPPLEVSSGTSVIGDETRVKASSASDSESANGDARNVANIVSRSLSIEDDFFCKEKHLKTGSTTTWGKIDLEGSELSPIIGFFIVTSPSESHAIKEASYCEAVRKLEFDRHSGPYALNHYGEWKHLSNYITKRTIERIEPIGGEITVAREVGLVDTVPKTYTEKRLMEQL
ncbi:hypothetical protein ACLOJK_032941 [Asimina triloba]